MPHLNFHCGLLSCDETKWNFLHCHLSSNLTTRFMCFEWISICFLFNNGNVRITVVLNNKSCLHLIQTSDSRPWVELRFFYGSKIRGSAGSCPLNNCRWPLIICNVKVMSTLAHIHNSHNFSSIGKVDTKLLFCKESIINQRYQNYLKCRLPKSIFIESKRVQFSVSHIFSNPVHLSNF